MFEEVDISMWKLGHKSCPKCRKKSEHLIWNHFCSNPESWMVLAGREGYTTHCPDCDIDVETIIVRMS